MKKPLSLFTKLLSTLIPVLVIFTLVIGASSFGIYYTSTKSTIDNLVSSSNNQFLENFDSYFDRIIDVSNSIQRKILNMDLYNNEEEITTYFDDIVNVEVELDNVAIYSTDGQSILFCDSSYNGKSDVRDEDWYIDAMNNQIIHIFSPIVSENHQYGFTLSSYITFNTEQDEGILKLDFDFTSVINFINLSDLGDGGHITIYDDNYDVVYCSETYSDEETEYVRETVLGSNIVNVNGIAYSLYVSTLSNTRWKVAVFTNYQSFYDTIINFLIFIICLTVLIIGLEIVIVYFIAKQVTKPIRALTKKMSDIKSLAYNESSFNSTGGSKEVLELSNSFDDMLKRIDELAKKSTEEEEEKRKAELKALQNQINPHFLYNTLDSVLYLIEQGENKKAEEMILALSKFFRISISKGKNIIPLEKEIEHASYYLQIQKIRFDKAFDYEINVNTDVSNLFIIKLILQPLVENALIHGIGEAEVGGIIKVNVNKENDFIRLDVIDNGFGIKEEKINEIYEDFKQTGNKKGVGLKNVFERLKLYYGDQAELKIISELDEGTDIEILIPIDKMQSDEEN